jgi:hypothetical protein
MTMFYRRAGIDASPCPGTLGHRFRSCRATTTLATVTAVDGAAVGGGDELDDDWQYVPRSMRPLRARAALSALVLLFAAALIVTLGLPSYASAATSGSGDAPSSPLPTVQRYQAPDYDAP